LQLWLDGEGITLRTRLSLSVAAQSANRGPSKGAFVVVDRRVRNGQTTFLRLREGGNWIFDCVDGRRLIGDLTDLLTAPREYVVPVGEERLGMTLTNVPPGAPFIRGIIEEGWAVRNGIQVGAVLRLANGEDTEAMPAAAFKALIAKRPIRLSIQQVDYKLASAIGLKIGGEGDAPLVRGTTFM